jgi:EPS-associated MarR family transcriptional regulator
MNERELREDIFNILRVLSSNRPFSQRDLSSRLGISLGKTNYLIKLLIQKGFLKIKSLTTKNHNIKKVRYALTKKGLDEKARLTYYLLKKKEAEYNLVKREWEEAVFVNGRDFEIETEKQYNQMKQIVIE